MQSRRIFVEQPLKAGLAVKLSAAAAAHVSRVLRLEPGDELTLFDGRGGQYPGTLLEARGATVQVRAGKPEAVERESALGITLVQGISRGERMDWVLQKATELGVRTIVPVITERSVVKLDAVQRAKKLQHWRGIAIAACEQCGRNRVPDIAQPLELAHWLASREPGAGEWLLDPAADQSLGKIARTDEVTLLIGPEGGLSPLERQRAREAGLRAARLGPRVLRTETAAIAAIAVLQATLGDF